MNIKQVTKRELTLAGFVVTEHGAVWSYKREVPRPLKAGNNGRYKFVVLGRGRSHLVGNYYVHRLVCIWFHGEPPTPEHVVNHKDGNTLNNHKDNLEWCTQSENITHSYQNKT